MPRFEHEPALFDQRVLDILNGKLPVDRSALREKPADPFDQWDIQSHVTDPLVERANKR